MNKSADINKITNFVVKIIIENEPYIRYFGLKFVGSR